MLTSCLRVRCFSKFSDLYSSMTSSPAGFLSKAFFTIYSHKRKKHFQCTIQSSRIKSFEQYTTSYLFRLRVKVIHCIRGRSQKKNSSAAKQKKSGKAASEQHFSLIMGQVKSHNNIVWFQLGLNDFEKISNCDYFD